MLDESRHQAKKTVQIKGDHLDKAVASNPRYLELSDKRGKQYFLFAIPGLID